MRAQLLAVLLAACAAGAAAADPDPAERAGRQVFLEGTSPSGARIGARIGMGGMDISGAPSACGNCHGADGRGRVEGGVEPPDIRWSELTKPYGHRHANRRHGPFDERSLKRLLAEGVDPDGNRLDAAMPRYAMSERDFGSLVAYLKRLETEQDPGLSADAIRIGTLLPLAGRQGETGAAVRDVLAAGFAAVNGRGGIHGRRLELVTLALPAEPAAAVAAARRLVAEQDVFALLAPLSAGVEAELSSAAVEHQVPVVGPLTLFPEDVRTSNPLVFHLLPGVPELAQLLAQEAALDRHALDQPVALLHADGAAGRATAAALQSHLEGRGWRQVTGVAFRGGAFDAPALAAALQARQAATLLVLSPGVDLTALARAAAAAGWTGRVLLPGPLASREILELPAAFASRVTLAYATAPGDRRDGAMRELAALGAAPRHLAVQLAAAAAGQLLVEALKRSGRDLSRRKLVSTLETVQGFETGLMPPVSYNADRRIGVFGGYLLAIDVEQRSLRPLGGYRNLP